MHGTRWRMTVLLAVVGMAIAACGGAGEDEAGGGGEAGAPAEVTGFDGTTIRLGVLTPLSGPVAVIGEPLTAGNEVWFEYLNSEGGVAGQYQVELVQRDTQYQTDAAVQQYNNIKGEVVAFTQLLGTPSTLAVLPLLQADDVIAAPASLDAPWVRELNLLPIGGPYQIQAINAMEYYFSNGGGTPQDTICAMVQDDAYGEAGLEGLEFAAERYEFTVANTQRFRVGTENFTGQIQALAGAQCDMVWLSAVPTEAGKIWGTAAQGQFTPQWIAQSPAWIDELAASPVAPYLQQYVNIVAEGTEWGDESVPGMRDMVARVEQFRPEQEPDYYFAFGYNQARAMTALLERAVELGDLSREGLLEASRQLGSVSFDGLTGDYTYGPAENREPPRTSTMFAVDPDKPFGLATVRYNFTSDAAAEFEFVAADS